MFQTILPEENILRFFRFYRPMIEAAKRRECCGNAGDLSRNDRLSSDKFVGEKISKLVPSNRRRPVDERSIFNESRGQHVGFQHWCKYRATVASDGQIGIEAKRTGRKANGCRRRQGRRHFRQRVKRSRREGIMPLRTRAIRQNFNTGNCRCFFLVSAIRRHAFVE